MKDLDLVSPLIFSPVHLSDWLHTSDEFLRSQGSAKCKRFRYRTYSVLKCNPFNCYIYDCSTLQRSVSLTHIDLWDKLNQHSPRLMTHTIKLPHV